MYHSWLLCCLFQPKRDGLKQSSLCSGTSLFNSCLEKSQPLSEALKAKGLFSWKKDNLDQCRYFGKVGWGDPSKYTIFSVIKACDSSDQCSPSLTNISTTCSQIKAILSFSHQINPLVSIFTSGDAQLAGTTNIYFYKAVFNQWMFAKMLTNSV